MIKDHLDKNNLHHAYLIEGVYEKILPEILEFIQKMDIKVVNNPDFCNMSYDSFKIEDARNLKSKSLEKAFSSKKKIYVVTANNFLIEAQNTLLKMFEEPIENTHFFIIVPDIDVLLKTLVSRFYLIKGDRDLSVEIKNAEKFVSLPYKDRIIFIKDLLQGTDDTEITRDTPKSKALIFLNALEIFLHKKYLEKNVKNIDFFEQIFKVREFLRQPGSSTKSLMESVALTIPIL